PLGSLSEIRAEDDNLHVACKACARIAQARARRRMIPAALVMSLFSFGGGAA
ncbi:MAG: hypothetical protein JNG85_11850, partial [Spirochaetaceae bacterium]|nr:hypothetical protein [Spirochaetaceae bacterium]